MTGRALETWHKKLQCACMQLQRKHALCSNLCGRHLPLALNLCWQLLLPHRQSHAKLTMRLAVSTTAGKPVITGLKRSCTAHDDSAHAW
jgi:hypothetical protein